MNIKNHKVIIKKKEHSKTLKKKNKTSQSNSNPIKQNGKILKNLEGKKPRSLLKNQSE